MVLKMSIFGLKGRISIVAEGLVRTYVLLFRWALAISLLTCQIWFLKFGLSEKHTKIKKKRLVKYFFQICVLLRMSKLLSVSSHFVQNLKIRTANAIIRDYDQGNIFFGLTLSASVWNRISRNHTKYLIQTIIISIELKLCEVSRNSFSNRCWNFHLYSLKNKKVLFLKKTHHNKKRALFTDSIFREGFDFGNFNFDCSWRRKTLYRKSRESNLSNEFTTIGAASSVARKWA